MAQSIGEAFMELGVRDARFNAAMSRAGERVVKFGATVGRIAVRAAAALTAAAGAFSIFAIKVAADAEEAASKFDVVFGGAAADARKEIDAFAKATGRSSVELQSLAGDTGDVIKALGFNETKARELSVALTKLGVDTASFKNKSEPDVLRAFTSALVGEREALKSLGVVILEADVKQEAFRKGLVKQGQALTPQIKALATFSLLQTKLSDAQGDAVRTAGSFTNRIRSLRGAFKDLSAAVGKAIIDEGTLGNTIANITEKIRDNQDTIVKFAGRFVEGIKTTIATMGDILIKVIGFFKKFALEAKFALKLIQRGFIGLTNFIADKFGKVVLGTLIAVLGGIEGIASLLGIETPKITAALNTVTQAFGKMEQAIPTEEIEKDLDKIAQDIINTGNETERLRAEFADLILGLKDIKDVDIKDPLKPVKDIEGLRAEFADVIQVLTDIENLNIKDPLKPVEDGADKATESVDKLNKAMFRTVGFAGIAAARQALVGKPPKRPAKRPPAFPEGFPARPAEALPIFPQGFPAHPAEAPPQERVPQPEVEQLFADIDADIMKSGILNESIDKNTKDIVIATKDLRPLLERISLAIEDRGVFV